MVEYNNNKSSKYPLLRLTKVCEEEDRKVYPTIDYQAMKIVIQNRLVVY